MIYEIHSKNDLVAGTTLTVRIPGAELDRKALYTLQADRPEFVLPFRHKNIDGQIEFVYQAGTLSKLPYLSGSRALHEYARLWQNILSPLLECGDWFMKPYSFALQAGHIYCDKNTQAVSYIYIPSRRDCSDYNDLKDMMAELAKHISVTDTELENKVLRAIMTDFDPREFLQLLKSYQAINLPAQVLQPVPATQLGPPPAAPQPEDMSQPPQKPHAQGDIIINIPEDGKPSKKDKGKAKDKGVSGGKKAAEPKKTKSGGLFGKKNPETPALPLMDALAPLAEGGPVQPGYSLPSNFYEVTQVLDNCGSGGPRLRLIGDSSLPQEISVLIECGEAFTIGRFDISIGRRQSSFEFDKSTKAVSRRHAVIERDGSGYNIIDLSSSAGTFVDGQKLPPNSQYRLRQGSRVSFGNAAADYVWEE